MSPISDVLKKELEYVIPQLRHWALKLECDEYDADGLVTDTVIKFLERPEVYDQSKGSLKGLLFTSLLNRARDFKKRFSRTYMKDFQAYLRNDAPIFENPKHDREILERELVQKIEKHMGDMPPRVSQIFRLFVFDGKDYHEIAQALGTSVANAKSAVHRGRVIMQSYLVSA